MVRVTLTVTLFLLATVSVSAEKVGYKGYELLSVYARNIEDAKTLLYLGEKHPQLDFWSHPAPEMNSTVLVPPKFVQEFKDVVKTQGISLDVLSDDVQSIVDAGSKRTPEAVVLTRNWASGHVIDHYNYHTYKRIVDYLHSLAAKYRKHVSVSTLKRRTYEGRSIAVVKLSGSSGYKKPAIVVEAGIHAREWVSPAAVLWFMEKILRDYGHRNSRAVQMLDKYDWYVIPVLNADGYEYTHSKSRLWRKNRRYIREDCQGVDLNRNFDIAFGTTGIDFNCLSEIYPGESAFSEPETANIRDLFNSLYQRVVAYVAVHSFSQVVLVPWAYTEYVSRPDNHVELDRVTKLMTQAISQRHGKLYIHGTGYETLNYAASGSSADWVMERKSNLYSVTFELRPKDMVPGFCLPASEIVPTGEELYASLIVLANEIRT